MNHRHLLAAALLLWSTAIVDAQLVAPRGHETDWKNGYTAGYDDATVAAAQLGLPALPDDVIYRPDATYHVAPNGNDNLADGSIARPFATIAGALQRIKTDRAGANGPKLAEISYLASGTYSQDLAYPCNNVLIDSYGQAPSTASASSGQAGSGQAQGNRIFQCEFV